jgi:hypothetical protein
MKFVRGADPRETLKIGAYVDPLYPLKSKMHKSLAKYISQVDAEDAEYDMDGWKSRPSRTIKALYDNSYYGGIITDIEGESIEVNSDIIELLMEIFPEFDQLEQDSIIMEAIYGLQEIIWESQNECMWQEAAVEFDELGICAKDDPDYDEKLMEWIDEEGYENESSLGHTQYFYSSMVYKWWDHFSESTQKKYLREFAKYGDN